MPGGIDKSPFQKGASPFAPVGGIVNEVSPDTVPESGEAAARLTPARALHVSLKDNAGNSINYADGTPRGSATGSLCMIDDGVNIQSMVGDTAGRPFFRLFNSDGTDNSLSLGGQIGQKVMIVGDSEKVIGSQKTMLLDFNTTLFTPGGSYTGPWIQVMGIYSAVNIGSFINVSGFGGASRYAAVSVQFSSNGSVADGDIVTINVGLNAGNPARVAIPVDDNFARLVIQEQGGYNWAAAGGAARTTFTGIPIGSGSFVSGVGEFIVAGDGSGSPMSPITVGITDAAGGSLFGWQGDASIGAGRIIGASGTNITGAQLLLTAERGGTTGTLTNTSVAASSTTLAASSTSRRGMVVHNDSSQALFLKYGSAASNTSYTFLAQAGEHWVMPYPLYTGIVTGIANAAIGTWRITTW